MSSKDKVRDPEAVETLRLKVGQAIIDSGKTNKELAADMGFDTPSVISMIKSGNVKIAAAKIPVIAEVLKLNTIELVMMYMAAYEPELAAALHPVLSQGEDAEKSWLKGIRTAFPDGVPKFSRAKVAELASKF